MPRYASRPPRSEMDCDAWYSGSPYDSLTVVEREPAFTGLLDEKGNEIWRVPDPVGFRIA